MLSRLNSVIWDMYISAVILLSKGKTPIQVKQKHGIIERENYNKPKSENSRQPGCPEEKVKAIEEALRYFQMI